MRKSIISTHHVLAMSAEPASKKTRMPVTLGYWKIRGVGSSCCLWSVSLLFMSLQFVVVSQATPIALRGRVWSNSHRTFVFPVASFTGHLSGCYVNGSTSR